DLVIWHPRLEFQDRNHHHSTSITQSPSPSTVNAQASPRSIENVGMRLPVITTMPALRSRLRSASRFASQASVVNGSSDLPSPIDLPFSVWRPVMPATSLCVTGFGAPITTPPFQQFSTIIE